MKANNLTICVPYKGCDKDCEYCISKITGHVKTDEALMIRNMPKVRKLAENVGVTGVLITGKGEPFLNYAWLKKLSEYFRDFPVEIQTNGKKLSEKPYLDECLRDLYNMGVNVIAISVDCMDEILDYSALFQRIQHTGMLVRLCINVTNKLGGIVTRPLPPFTQAYVEGVDQVLFRKIMVPENVRENDPVAVWIKENVDPTVYNTLYHEFVERKDVRFLRMTSFGMPVYSLKGVTVAFSDYCVQESHSDDEVRSLIFQEDGHLYTHWGDRGSIIL